jgi:hypothetical protein
MQRHRLSPREQEEQVQKRCGQTPEGRVSHHA